MTPKTPRTKRLAFGGYAINFAGRKETIEDVMGEAALAPPEMTRRLWAHVKRNGLAKKG